ncbi:protein pigeon [Macrosteles quadrilineatus]|uniref:protein pigeon n=1 Tax=Macrosteles quadrilineatus TaxID=74068 RepID=UPI0023E15F41|nr:protein pigeon [Macrosteles quadrilineatus]
MATISVQSNLRDEILPLKNDRRVNDLRVIGLEENSVQLFTWVGVEDSNSLQFIEAYDRLNKNIEVLHVLPHNSSCSVIQASVNEDKTLLAYVTKTTQSNKDDPDTPTFEYEAFLHSIEEARVSTKSLGIKKPQQIMTQFLNKKKQSKQEKLLVFIHQTSVTLYQVELRDHGENEEIVDITSTEQVLKSFTWAQWDAVNQCLYYIHYRKPPQAVEGEVEGGSQTTPILSTLQFHHELPHETVLNIPLNLPQLSPSVSLPCGVYEDDPVPLRVHDCSLDLTIVADHRGVVCICHHYLYQPVKPPMSDKMVDATDTVHLAYSVTMLHHGRVVHCVVPGVAWADAPSLRPSFVMYGDQHMLVISPGLFIHLLDIGPEHEPCCHIVLANNTVTESVRLVPLLDGSDQLIDLMTLDVVQLQVDPQLMVEAYLQTDMVKENRLAILHYFIVHLNDMDLVSELLSPLAEHCMDLNVAKILQELLVGGSYASVARSLPSDALSLIDLLPLTTWNPSSTVEVKLSPHFTLSLSQECLWNPAVMLLSPQQRLVPYRGDMWTRLWDYLAAHGDLQRFCPTTVADKLMVSLVCYQPEALSRCSTPLSPGGMVSSVGVAGISDLASGRGSKTTLDPLPFFEVEPSAASKQEHIISVNLREVSMHLLKQSRSRESPMQVHAVATRYAAAQLEQSRQLCQLITKAASVDTTTHRGFMLIDQMSEDERRVFFALLERYCLAVEGLAFPLPQGFPSFLAYLGYRTLSFSTFMQYVQSSVLQLQIDVMKAIMNDLQDSKEGVQQKLRLIQLLPRSRGKRLLNQWQHPASLMVRARQHASNILSGVEGAQARRHPQRQRSNTVATRGLAAFPSEDRLSPLDTFFDLLTAKANLAELDFNLLIAATTASTEEFFY